MVIEVRPASDQAPTEAYHQKRRYKSRVSKVPLVCPTCGTTFEVFPEAVREGRKYCSSRCSAIAHTAPRPAPRLCACGCGQPVPERPKLRSSSFKGYIHHHYKTPRKSPADVAAGKFKRAPVTMEQIEERFWSHVEKTDSCWLWTGSTNRGYGKIMVNGKSWRAHRLSYVLANGPISDDVFVCHDCDKNYPVGDLSYRRCVRPDHLFAGTPLENTRDCIEKGRFPAGERSHSRRHPECRPRGEASGVARLTEERVAEMRLEYGRGGISLSKLAAKHGVAKRTALDVIHRRTWAHVP